jgi:hypothetical protein
MLASLDGMVFSIGNGCVCLYASMELLLHPIREGQVI